MAARPTTLSVENLESRLNLSSILGAAVVDSFTNHLRSQDRAILRSHSRLITLDTNGSARNIAGNSAKLAKKLGVSPLIAIGNASTTPVVSISATEKSISLSWTNTTLNATGFRIERSTDGINFTTVALVSAKHTSYTDTKVLPGVNYQYTVTVFNKADSVTANAAHAALVPPPPPASATSLTDTKDTLSSITLAWHDNAANEQGFHIYRSTDGTDFSLLATVKANSKTFTDTGLTSDTPYYYEIGAFNAGGETLTNGNHLATTATPPALAPLNLSTANITGTSVALHWTDSSANLSGFRIYRSTNGKSFTLVGNVDAGATSFTDTGLSSLSKYTYKVSAWNASSNTYSKNITASTLAAAPNAPSNPAFTNVTTNSLTLNWTPDSANQTGFHIYRSNDGTNYTLVATTASDASSFTDNNLTDGTTYWYNVAAFNAGGENASSSIFATTIATSVNNQSAPATPTAPDAPANVAFSDVATTSLSLNWTESNTANANGIHIYRSTNGGTYTLVGTLAATATTWNDSALASNTQYSYEVAAYNTVGETTSLAASTSTLLAAPNSPSTPTFTAVTTSSVTLNWQDSGAITGYNIYRSTNGADFTLVTTTIAGATSWSDSNLASSTNYYYQVGAYNAAGETKSSASFISTLTVPPNTPANVTFSNIATTSLTLNWTESNTANTNGIHIYRSTNGGTYALVGTLAATATTWNDASLTSGTQYAYKVAAYNTAGETTSLAASTSTLLAAPNSPSTPTFTAVTTSSVTLNWQDSGAITGYNIYRSTDGANYTLVTTAAAGATSWSDSNLAASTTYYYQIGAYNAGGETKSAAVHTATLAPVTNSAPVTFTTQNMTSFNELVITGTTGNDSIVVTQSNNILNIVANGQSYNYTNTYGDLKIYGVNGNDTITVQSSVNIATLIYGGNGNDVINNLTTGKATIVTIGNGVNTVTGNGINTAYWVNTTDTVNATAAEIALGGVNRVSNFYQPFSTDPNNANYIPRTLAGQNLTDPTDSGAETRLLNSSFWGTGASITDINQTGLADCYYLAPLASLAYSEPQKLMNMGVDLGDGTYAVRFVRNGVTSYVRVDGDLSTGYWDYGLGNQTPGADGNQWGSIFEKAYAFFRSGKNTYASLNYGYQGQTYSDLGLLSNSATPSITSPASAMSLINSALAAKHGVVASTVSNIVGGAQLVESHVYTVIGAYTNSSGTVMIQLRNPWGVDGFNDDSNPNDGLVTISYATFAANFNSLNYTTV